MKLKNALTFLSLLVCLIADAQVEGAYFDAKTFKAIGFGGHLNFKFPITESGYLTTEAGVYIFRKEENNAVLVPFLLGYQHTINGSGTGIFVEPLAGYSIGATDIIQYDANGVPVPDENNNPGEYQEQQVKGATAGFATGYIFSGRTPLTLGLRYERVFVSKDPGVNLFSLRITWPLFGGKREE